MHVVMLLAPPCTPRCPCSPMLVCLKLHHNGMQRRCKSATFSSSSQVEQRHGTLTTVPSTRICSADLNLERLGLRAFLAQIVCHTSQAQAIGVRRGDGHCNSTKHGCTIAITWCKAMRSGANLREQTPHLKRPSGSAVASCSAAFTLLDALVDLEA